MPYLLFASLAAFHAWSWTRERSTARRIAAGRPRGRPALPRHPRVSVLVAAWNGARDLEAHIASVLALSYPDVEYILCAGGNDETYEVARRALGGRGMLLKQESGEGKQRALRRALRHASGEVVYLTDADCVLDDEGFERAIEPVIRGADAASGRCRPFAGVIEVHDEVLCQWAPEYVAQSSLGELSNGLQGGNCAVTRAALARAGGFDEDVATGTDYHLARKLAALGAPIAFARWSFVPTSYPTSVGVYVRRQSRWLRNHWIHGARSGDRAAQTHALRTWVAAGLLIVLPLLGPLLGRWAMLPWLGLALHGVAARVRYVLFLCKAEELGWHPRALALSPMWFGIDVAAWMRSLVDLVVPSLRGRW